MDTDTSECAHDVRGTAAVTAGAQVANHEQRAPTTLDAIAPTLQVSGDPARGGYAWQPQTADLTPDASAPETTAASEYVNVPASELIEPTA